MLSEPRELFASTRARQLVSLQFSSGGYRPKVKDRDAGRTRIRAQGEDRCVCVRSVLPPPLLWLFVANEADWLAGSGFVRGHL